MFGASKFRAFRSENWPGGLLIANGISPNALYIFLLCPYFLADGLIY